MSAVELSTEVVESHATELANRSRRWMSAVTELDAALAHIGVDDRPSAATAIDELTTAARSLSIIATRLAALAHDANQADRFGNCRGASFPDGDPDETFTCVDRPTWRLTSGRDLLLRALADTADDSVIGRDEFEIIRVGANRFVVVLAGVTDLGRPSPGYDDSGTVRDLDQGAIESARGPEVASNEYARYVSDAVFTYIPAGSQITIVGHSYGADTALDLAADSEFNGERYNVTHVAAFGYHAKQHLAAVPDSTSVLVVNNATDLVVAAESVLDGAHIVADGQHQLARAVAAGDFGAIEPTIADIASGWVEVVHDIAAASGAAIAAARRATSVSGEGNHHIVTFAGGTGRDGGHSQDRYLAFLGGDGGGVDVVAAFAESLTDHGYAPTAVAVRPVSVDVSIDR